MTVSPKNIVEGFDRLRECVSEVLELRRRAWEKICLILRRDKQRRGISAIYNVGRIRVLASSSRGGTSVTVELLQWQGAECVHAAGCLLTLPGEEKPHLILAGLAFPTRTDRFDDLNESDVCDERVSKLLGEIASEVGHPVSRCDNIQLYATQLYRRLLLQWPLALAEWEMDSAILALTKALRIRFPQGYCDGVSNRQQVLATCVDCFPFIRPSFYDCWPARTEEDELMLAGRCWSIEETPFVVPPPWHNASQHELEEGCLLLRDPSNAWRLRFWRAVFPTQEIGILHLVRDPRESIQGLCDGWNYPFGFQTMPSDEVLVIPGYTDGAESGRNEWKRCRLNFSINRVLSCELLNDHQPLSLVRICARQWRDSHENIMADSEHLSLPRSIVRFADLREETEKTFKAICGVARLEISASGLKYVYSFSNRLVMATSNLKPASHERWKSSSHANEIELLVSSRFFDEVCRKLGFDKLK